MQHSSGVRITVHSPVTTEAERQRIGACRFAVESQRALPRSPYSGTVRVGGSERTVTGTYPCRLLKHFTVTRVDDTTVGAEYAVTVDLSDEGAPHAGPYMAPGFGVRRPTERIDVVCKRIAGIFGRVCEDFRPPSVVVELGE